MSANDSVAKKRPEGNFSQSPAACGAPVAPPFCCGGLLVERVTGGKCKLVANVQCACGAFAIDGHPVARMAKSSCGALDRRGISRCSIATRMAVATAVIRAFARDAKG